MSDPVKGPASAGRPPAGAGTLLLYTRPGCHLCDDARGVLRRIGAPFVEIDIDSDDALLKRYLERIPVVVLDGEELYDFFVDEADLVERLRIVPGRA